MTVGVVFVLVGLAVGTFGLSLIVRPGQVRSRASSWTPVDAEVLNVRQENRYRSAGGGAGKVTVTAITYRYNLPGTGEEQLVSADLGPGEVAQEGGTVRVLVDPNDPRRSQREGERAPGRAHGCSTGGMLMLMGLLFFAVGALVWVTAR